MSLDCCVALPHNARGLAAVCDCGISGSYSLTIFGVVSNINLLFGFFINFYVGYHKSPIIKTNKNHFRQKSSYLAFTSKQFYF